MEKAKAKKMKYNFSYFLLISKTYKLSRLPKKGKKKNRSGQQDTVTFVNAEEELFFKVRCTISVHCTLLFVSGCINDKFTVLNHKHLTVI